ncbi:MAG: 5-(carboxyamino)imidazole ribonucleotide mutase [Spirochaetes bacterium]|nr:5-(carboxyamino)imidazole ribonucleotide mutase [Spirochaetota bacterium]
MSEVGIILGSDSDLPKVKKCFQILDEFKIGYEVIISSAHRTPEQTKQWVSGAKDRGIKVIIAVAGGAAHLPGVVASYTLLPVIGVPVETNLSGGMDSILSILQMPGGIPVAAMPAGSAGGMNSALFAVNILALNNETYYKKLLEYRENMKTGILKKNDLIAEKGLMQYIKELEK